MSRVGRFKKHEQARLEQVSQESRWSNADELVSTEGILLFLLDKLEEGDVVTVHRTLLESTRGVRTFMDFMEGLDDETV